MATTQQLVARIREKLNDVIEPYLYSTGKIYDAISSAQRDFAEHTLCLQSRILSVLVKNIADYPLDATIIKVRRVVSDTGREILPCTVEEIETKFIARDYGQTVSTNWRLLKAAPKYVVTDLTSRSLRFVPIPIVNEVIYLESYIIPKDVGLTSEPVIPPRWSDELLAGALAQLYRLQDTELYDPRESDKWEQIWQTALYKAMVLERDQRGTSIGRFNRNGVW